MASDEGGGVQLAEQTPPAPARPGWLAKRSAVTKPSTETARATTPVALVQPLPEPSRPRPTTLGAWPRYLWLCLSDWWRGLYLGWGLLSSLVFHGTLLLILALIVFKANDKVGLLVNGAFSEFQDGDDFEVPLDTRLDTSFGDKTANAQFSAATVVDSDSMASVDDLLAGGAGDGDQVGDGESDLMKGIKAPEWAVVQGSFTVWTEPKDPMPRKPYDIIIQIKLPSTVKQYKLTDLSGFVEGTDGYRKLIKYKTTDRARVKEGIAQIAVRIPGGALLVKDVIDIRSRLLKEQQRIEIEF